MAQQLSPELLQILQQRGIIPPGSDPQSMQGLAQAIPQQQANAPQGPPDPAATPTQGPASNLLSNAAGASDYGDLPPWAQGIGAPAPGGNNSRMNASSRLPPPPPPQVNTTDPTITTGPVGHRQGAYQKVANPDYVPPAPEAPKTPAATGVTQATPPPGATAGAEGTKSLTLPTPQAKTIPGHELPIQGPEETRLERETQDEKAKALEELNKAQLHQNELNVTGKEQLLAAAQTEEDAKRKRAEEVRKGLAPLLASQKQTDLEARTGQIDSGRAWRDAGFGTKLLASLADGLGAFGAAMTHTQFKSRIRQIIEDDVADQKANLANKWEASKTAHRDYAEYLAAYGTPEQAEEAAMVAGLHRAAAQTDVLAAQANSPIIAANGKIKAQELRGEANDRFRQFFEKYIQPATTAGTDWNEKAATYADKMEDENVIAGRTVTPQMKEEWKGGYLENHIGRRVVTGASNEGLPQKGSGKVNEKDAAVILKQADILIDQLKAAPSSSITAGHPLNYAAAMMGIQGGQGQQGNIARTTYNNFVDLTLHKYGVRLGDPAKAAAFAGQWQTGKNDTPQTISKKTSAFRSFVASGVANAAPPANTDKDLGK